MKFCLLLGIICRICEDSRIESSRKPVTTFDHNTVAIGFQELVVKEYRPLRMHDFSTAMSHQGFDGAIGSHVLSGEVLKCVWELQHSVGESTRQQISDTSLQFGNKQCGCTDG